MMGVFSQYPHCSPWLKKLFKTPDLYWQKKTQRTQTQQVKPRQRNVWSHRSPNFDPLPCKSCIIPSAGESSIVRHNYSVSCNHQFIITYYYFPYIRPWFPVKRTRSSTLFSVRWWVALHFWVALTATVIG